MSGRSGARFGPRSCTGCSRPYTPSGPRQQYCTPACRREAAGLGPSLPYQVRACRRCGTRYVPSAGQQRYCTPGCRRGGPPPVPRAPGRMRASWTDWDRAIGDARRALRTRGAPYAGLPATAGPCLMVVTGKPGSNGRVLLVRCRCQAQTRGRAAARFYGYDILGEAQAPQEAARLWREHAGPGSTRKKELACHE